MFSLGQMIMLALKWVVEKFDNGVYQRTAYMTNVQYLDANNQLVHLPNNIQITESRCFLEGDDHTKTTQQDIPFVLVENVVYQIIVIMVRLDKNQ